MKASETRNETITIPPLMSLHPVARKKILDQLRSVTLEQRLLCLIFTTMINQLDPEDYNLSYVKKNKARLVRINLATGYVPEIVDASNEIWKEAFTALPVDVSITSFMVALIYRRPKPFKKLNINYKDFVRLNRNHGIEGHSMATLRVVNKMLELIDEKIEAINQRIADKATAEIERMNKEKGK